MVSVLEEAGPCERASIDEVYVNLTSYISSKYNFVKSLRNSLDDSILKTFLPEIISVTFHNFEN